MKILFVLSSITIVLAVWRIIRTLTEKNISIASNSKNSKIEIWSISVCFIVNLINVFCYIKKFYEGYLMGPSLVLGVLACFMFMYGVTAYLMFGE